MYNINFFGSKSNLQQTACTYRFMYVYRARAHTHTQIYTVIHTNHLSVLLTGYKINLKFQYTYLQYRHNAFYVRAHLQSDFLNFK